MRKKPLDIADYPLAEKHAGDIKGARGLSLEEISMSAVLSGRVAMEDLRITPDALINQAEIANAAGRAALADNFRRASELATVPQDIIMQTYELLRPGRVRDKQVLLDAASRLRSAYSAERMAAFVEEAAAVYERRGLFTYRY